MYKVRKTMEIAASHRLDFSGTGTSEPLHGHNWIITVWCRSEELDADGMVVDFLEIERKIHGTLDHQDLNAVLPFNPTAENIAKWVCDQIDKCYMVEVQESSGAAAIYER